MSPSMPILVYILAACIGGSLLSIAIAAFAAFHVRARWVPTFVSYAVGALLGAVFLDLMPHIFEESRAPGRVAAFILFGILAFFVLEKLLLWRHHHHGEDGDEGHAPSPQSLPAHDHGRSGYMIVVGDSFHNFTDGVIIASAFLADVRLGVVTALAIIAHEIPQEIGDFLVLLHSGFSKRKALLMNALSGVATVLGALLGYFALSAVSGFLPEILAIAAASMIYVAVADLIPGLHKRTAIGETMAQVAFIMLGVTTIWVIHALLSADH
jgi:zinc and cadmium transporter